MNGTELNSPAFPIRMLRRAWWTRTNLKEALVFDNPQAMGISYLAECVKDLTAGLSCGNRLHALHLADSSNGRGHDVGETSDDLRERSLSDDDQRSVDNGDALSWSLE